LRRYNEGEHDDVDKRKLQEGKTMIATAWNDRYNPAKGWEEFLDEDGSRPDGGITGFSQYDPITRCGTAISHAVIDATPTQVMAR
jgi:hypothetical protein